MKIRRTLLSFVGIQIKSEEIFKEFAKSVDIIEEKCGIHSCTIRLKDIFFCPDIDVDQCKNTPMERLLIGLIGRLKTKQ
jgi:hypothetical protein